MIYGGARFARYSRTLYDPLNVAYDEDSVRLFGRMFKIPDQVTNYVLPSVMLKYSILDGKYMVRAVYGHSIDRPQFREQGFDQWYNFLTNTNFIGNPSLQNSMIKSADLRFEYYPKGSEYISVGGFYKHIDKPIQLFITPPGTNGAREGFYSNTEYAKVIGVELEVRKKFDFVSFPLIKNLSMNLNASYIWSESKVDLRKSNLRDGTPSGIYQFIRLQGASPYLVNFALYYERLSSGTLFSAIYNLTWDRVKDYGGSPDIGNQVEGRIHRVDLVFKQRITKFLTAKFSIQDLLNRPIRIYRDENSNYNYDPGIQNATPNEPENPLRYRGDYVERSFKPGTYYSLGLSLNLQKNK